MQSLALYKSCLFSMYLDGNTVDMEKPDKICPYCTKNEVFH